MKNDGARGYKEFFRYFLTNAGRWLLFWAIVVFTGALIEKKFESISLLAGIVVSVIAAILSWFLGSDRNK